MAFLPHRETKREGAEEQKEEKRRFDEVKKQFYFLSLHILSGFSLLCSVLPLYASAVNLPCSTNHICNNMSVDMAETYQKRKPLSRAANYTRGTFFEIGALSECLFRRMITLFSSFQLDLPTEGMENKPDILCVHGYLHNESPWGRFRNYLQKAGAGPVNVVSYSSVVHAIPKNSLQIKKKIEQIKLETGRDVKILIGHSQGGLECLEYALEYAPKDQLIYIITLSSPLHGTKMAKIGLGPSAKQMHVGSDYINSLHKRLKNAKHIRVFALASEVDLVIRPQTSALMEEYPFVENMLFEDIGHVTFLYSEKIMEKVVEYLINQSLLSR